MGFPDQNPGGYAATKLVDQVEKFEARPLLVHGLADTNVHLQNTVNLIEAMMRIDKPFDFVPLSNSDHHYGGDGLVAVLSESVDYFMRHIGDQKVEP
jgi:dipeptidyl-peptidase-4